MNLPARISLALLPLFAVVLFAAADFQRISPGKLIAAHRFVEELQGKSGCAACHISGAEAIRDACFQCHETIERQVMTSEALHGKLSAKQKQDCAECHLEHVPNSQEEMLEFGFRLATEHPSAEFKHQTVDFHLDGRHDSLSCIDCHPNADADPLPSGSSRFLDQVQSCDSCHDDPHNGMMKRGCEECHGQEHKFDDLTHFPHDDRVPLHGSHGGLECTDCHSKGSPTSVEALSDADIAVVWRTCSSCHESPHATPFLDALPNPASNQAEDGCVLCHSEKHSRFHGNDVIWEDEWHQASGFSLTPPHADQSCEECHQKRESKQDFGARYPGRSEQECRVCHVDPHQGQFDHEPFLQQDCRACHDGLSFKEHGFDVDRHNQESFALTGSHAALACNECHELVDTSDPSTRQFRGTPRSCEDCHADAHAPAMEGGDCARCHTTKDFQEMAVEFEHDKWTGFALQQGHANLKCEACHERTTVADATGRTLGRVHQIHPGKPEACDGCHADVHAGSFDPPLRDALVEGRIGCDRCHQTSTFKQLHAGGFDHQKWTGFGLSGAHQQASCESCHGKDGSSDRLGKVTDRYSGDVHQCATCHSDPHDGDFDSPRFPVSVQGRQGCNRCHDDRSFRTSATGAFDHGFWTSFELVGAHAEAACTSCHPALDKPGPNGRRLARAVGSSCVDCHSDVHAGQFLDQGKQDCLRCHDQEIETFAISDFDHDRLSHFALDATHSRLSCDQCHVKSPTKQGRDAVRYKPLASKCQDCHTVSAVSNATTRGGK